MTATHAYDPDPTRDLVLEREVDVPVRLVWAAWTRPEHLVKWFTPAPWQTVACEIDLRPGGRFKTVMRGPEGQTFDEPPGCYLEVVPERKLVWTSALGPGFRPAPYQPDGLPFTAVLLFEPRGAGTRYTAIALHPSADLRERHAAMGFHDGWGKATDQLVAWARAELAAGR